MATPNDAFYNSAFYDDFLKTFRAYRRPYNAAINALTFHKHSDGVYRMTPQVDPSNVHFDLAVEETSVEGIWHRGWFIPTSILRRKI